MHYMKSSNTVFTTRYSNTYLCGTLGFTLFFNIFFYSSFKILNKMITAQMSTVIPYIGDRLFLTFTTNLSHYNKPCNKYKIKKLLMQNIRVNFKCYDRM